MIGITGAPGSGKSSLTDALITHLRELGQQVAVLAVDPTSPFTGGAILGDRVRMQGHATDPGVFIRSMATRGHLGGLASAARSALRVLDAAGFGWLIVETVGVGQVEVEIVDAADTTVVVLTPGAGDSIQANKAGLMEVADLFVVNKADRPGARDVERHILQMLELTAFSDDDLRPEIVLTTATAGEGIRELWAAVLRHKHSLETSGLLGTKRDHRLRKEVKQLVVQDLMGRIEREVEEAVLDAVIDRRLNPIAAAQAIAEKLMR